MAERIVSLKILLDVLTDQFMKLGEFWNKEMKISERARMEEIQTTIKFILSGISNGGLSKEEKEQAKKELTDIQRKLLSCTLDWSASFVLLDVTIEKL